MKTESVTHYIVRYVNKSAPSRPVERTVVLERLEDAWHWYEEKQEQYNNAELLVETNVTTIVRIK